MTRWIVGGAVGIIVLGTVAAVPALDVSDGTPEWTEAGKELAALRATLPPYDEMVRIPAGSFTMGSDRKKDRNATRPEMPQRRVHLDAYEIDKYEVTTVQFLRFILATDRPP
ncbi:MAG: formylglycine-generating enzyme family protein, partial [bacterium]